jgi:rhomboid-like protein
MVGASGAIFGLLLAFAYLFPNMPLYFMFIPVPIKAKYFVGAYIVIELYLGFSNSGSSIAHLAHVGGALFGYLLIKVWRIKKGYY